MIKYGILHCHSENSIDDSTLSTDELCRVAKEKGAPAVSLTDHGTTMGTDDFLASAKKYDIKPIVGSEVYFLDPDTGMRSHLILYAKNLKGFLLIAKAIATGVQVNDAYCLTEESLKMFKGQHDVIATSACINGVLGSVILFNKRKQRTIDKIQQELDELQSEYDKWQAAENHWTEEKERLKDMKTELSELKKLANASFTGKERNYQSKKKKLEDAGDIFNDILQGNDKRAKRFCQLMEDMDIVVSNIDDFQDALEKAERKVSSIAASIQQEKMDAEEAAGKVPEFQKKVDDLTKETKDLKNELDDLRKVKAKYETREDRIKKLEGEKLSRKRMVELIGARVNLMKDTFGKDFYIEVQNHGIPEEKDIYPYLAKQARKLGIPIVAANDVHVGENKEELFKARQIRRSCRFKHWEEEMEGDRELYIKTDEELEEALLKILPKDQVAEAMENVGKIVDACNFTWEKENHYPKAKVEDAGKEIRKIAESHIDEKYGAAWDKEKQDRFNYEMEIITSMGYADYFYITYDIINVARILGGMSYEDLDYFKEHGDEMSMEEYLSEASKRSTHPNLSIGLGRGSAAGSVVCYLLGITNIDPFKYDLLFERFLNPERVSMPDIDTDFRYDIRVVLLSYLKKRYGENAISQIQTVTLLQGKSAIDKVVMILGSRDNADYRSIGEKLKRKDLDYSKSLKDPENIEVLYKDIEEGIEKEIADCAVLMDGNVDHTGLHAAGVIISDNENLMDNIPLYWDEGSNLWKTQCDAVQAEGHGLLKMDLLLLKTLDVITYTVRLIEQKDPDFSKKHDIENLPIEKAVLDGIYSSGKTKSVFQFESAGMVKYLKQLKPESINDIIAMNAMYRPGPMDGIPDYIEAKQSGVISYDTPELEPILRETYGQIVYQEQVMQIVRDLAGYSLGQSDLVRRAMAKKHEDELLRERDSFIHGDESRGIKGCIANGVSEEAANKIFDKMTAFASYAFNKSHAAVYALTSYITAWLKWHYTTEFECAVLNYTTKQEDIPSIIEDCKSFGITILPPDVNKSDAQFTIEGDGQIRFGLSFIRNMKSAADTVVANRHGSYITFGDFVRRSGMKDASMRLLIRSGACDCFFSNGTLFRNKIMSLYEEMTDMIDKIEKDRDKMAKLQENTKEYKDLNNEVQELARQFQRLKIQTDKPMNATDRLEDELFLLSVYFSGNPLDDYEVTTIKNHKNVSDLEDGDYASIACCISEAEEKKTRKGDKMWIAKGSDYTGTIPLVLFPDAYSKFSTLLSTKVLGMNGKMMKRGEEEFTFVVDKVFPVNKKQGTIIIEVTDKSDFQNKLKVMKASRSHDGLDICFFYLVDGRIYRQKARIKESVARDNGWTYYVDNG